MLIQEEIKTKINQVDFQLKEVFEKVSIVEKSDRFGNYFEILSESQNKSIRSKIYKKEMISENIRWFYQVNTLNEASDWVERISNIETLALDMDKALLKNMSEDYYEQLQQNTELINESVDNNNQIERSLEAQIKSVLESFNLNVKDVVYSDEAPLFENNGFMTTSPDKKITFKHQSSSIKVSDKFRIESEIKKFAGINYVSFGDTSITIDYSNN